jgi:mRNA interferase HigB
MQVRSVGRLEEFIARHADAARWLRNWLAAALDADWRSLQEVRKTFPHADGVKVKSGRTVTVFNVRGNKYRLIVTINYPTGIIIVGTMLTHAEYDKDQWKETL